MAIGNCEVQCESIRSITKAIGNPGWAINFVVIVILKCLRMLCCNKILPWLLE